MDSTIGSTAEKPASSDHDNSHDQARPQTSNDSASQLVVDIARPHTSVDVEPAPLGLPIAESGTIVVVQSAATDNAAGAGWHWGSCPCWDQEPLLWRCGHAGWYPQSSYLSAERPQFLNFSPWLYAVFTTEYAFFKIARGMLTNNWIVGQTPKMPGDYPGIVSINVTETVLLGISLVCSLVVQVAVLMRLHEVKVMSASTMMIVGSALQLITNLLAVVLFNVRTVVPAGAMLSNGACSAIIACCTMALSLLLFVVDARELRRKGFKYMTNSERKLSYAAIMTIWYFLFGGFYETASQFVVHTMLTIGYGNIVPKTVPGKLCMLLYTLFGLGIYGYNILSFEESVATAAKREAKTHVDFWRHIRDGDNAVDDSKHDVVDEFATQSNDDPLPLTRTYTRMSTYENPWVAQWMLIRVLMYMLVCWFIGAFVFALLEPSWGYFDSFYFCFVTMAGIGFGDVTANRPWTVEFWYIFTFNAMATFLFFVRLFGEFIVARTVHKHTVALERTQRREQRLILREAARRQMELNLASARASAAGQSDGVVHTVTLSASQAKAIKRKQKSERKLRERRLREQQAHSSEELL
ncbi:hypothetical protein BC831DRAFT_442901 [Entophlyctis helioformis]|nr:hypothetical protein BC831DRAFT_442901 [Entophlyctis helioformis]